MLDFILSRILRSDLNLNPYPKDSLELEKLSANLKDRLRYYQETLEAAAETSLLRKEHIAGKVLDFGVSRGLSTALLARSGSDVIGVEIFEPNIVEAQRLGLVPADKLIAADGIRYLEEAAPDSLDLITAFMLGPDTNGQLSTDLMRVSQNALKENGALLVASDVLTIYNVQNANTFSNFKMVGRTIFVANKRAHDQELARTTFPAVP